MTDGQTDMASIMSGS